MTNLDKFYDVFGFEPLKECIMPDDLCERDRNSAADRKYNDCRWCPYLEWWDKEYDRPDLLPFE